MQTSAKRVLLEALLDQSLRRFADAPNRELRKLVDLGGTLVTGQSQKKFFDLARSMLEQDDSPYYTLVTQLVQHTDRKALKQFGIALGYDSWTRGAAQIRRQEREAGYNFPWTLIFEEGCTGAPLSPERLSRLLAEARGLGVHSFFFRLVGDCVPLDTVLELAEECPDCAFLLLLDPEALPERSGPVLAAHPNCLSLLKAGAGCALEDLAGLLYDRRALFGLWESYGPGCCPDAGRIDALCELAAQLGAPLALFSAEDGCTDEECRSTGKLVCKSRLEPAAPALAADLYTDVLLIDQIISQGSCTAQVWPDGRMAVDGQLSAFDLHRHGLAQVLKTVSARL